MENKKREEDRDLGCCACGHSEHQDLGDNCNCGDDCKRDDNCDCGDDCKCDDDCDCDCNHDYNPFNFEEYDKYIRENYPKRRSSKFDYWLYYCSRDDFGKGMFGLLVLIFGILYLGRNLKWWNFDINWAVFWPVVLILVGLVIIAKRKR